MHEDVAYERLVKGELLAAMAMLVGSTGTSVRSAARRTPSTRWTRGSETRHRRRSRAQRVGPGRQRGQARSILGALLATLRSGTIADTKERILALGKFGRDPRISTALCRIVSEVPFTSNGSRPTWLVIFDRLALLEDPRTIARLSSAKAGWGIRANQRAWLEARVDALAARLRERFPAGAPVADGETQKALDRIEAALANAAPTPKAPAAPTTDLLAAIYQSPQDDALRSVYADWLEERGDPRAELIALQLQPERTKTMLAREKVLLKQHEREWIGPIAPVVIKKDTVFERGFLAGCQVRFRNERDVRAYGSLPAWATVERMTHGLPGAPPVDQMRWLTWIDPAMKSLRDVNVFPDSLKALCSAPEPWRIERLRWGSWQVRKLDEESRKLLEETDKLPNLQWLKLLSRPPVTWLPRTRFASKLRELVMYYSLDDDDEGTFAGFLSAAAKLASLERIVVMLDWKQNITFTRDKTGRHSVAHTEISPGQLWDLTAALDKLPVGTLTELEVTRHADFAKLALDETRLPTLREACKRHALARLDLDGLVGANRNGARV